MNSEDINVSDDHLLMQEVMERHGIEAKEMAIWTGIARSTIYKYMIGAATIPSVIWRVLFERTLDPAVAKLITGGLPFILVPLFKKPQPACDAATLCSIVKVRKTQLACESLVLDIIGDGKIDDADARLIEEYKKIFPESVMQQAAVFQAVTHGYKEHAGEDK